VVSIDRLLNTADFKNVLKEPGPLKSQKTFLATRQQFMCSGTDQIMCLLASKIRYRCVFFLRRLDSVGYSAGILVLKNFDEHISRV
jgi:hypothetical protein